MWLWCCSGSPRHISPQKKTMHITSHDTHHVHGPYDVLRSSFQLVLFNKPANECKWHEASVYVAHNLRIYIYDDLYLQPPRDLFFLLYLDIFNPASAGIFWRLLSGRLMELDDASIIERIVQQRPQVSVPLDLNLVRGESWMDDFQWVPWNFIHHSLGFFSNNSLFGRCWYRCSIGKGSFGDISRTKPFIQHDAHQTLRSRHQSSCTGPWVSNGIQVRSGASKCHLSNAYLLCLERLG